MAAQQRKTGLGKGLGALLQQEVITTPKEQPAETPASKTPSSPAGSINFIKVEQIAINPFQPRTDFDENALRELSESIEVQGLIQPITVRQIGKNEYQLISGERRLRASKLAGITEIPAYVRTANDQQMLEMALIENIQRENLNAIEIALSFQRMIEECSLKQEELGDRVSKNRSTVTNYLRLLKLPPVIQAAIRDGDLSMGHARALINVGEIDKQLFIFKEIVEKGFSITNLSTGQRKRLALIAAILEEKPIIVLDEWAADQDPYFRKKFYEEILPYLKKEGFTIFAVTHDDRYYHCADKIYKMESGKLQEETHLFDEIALKK